MEFNILTIGILVVIVLCIIFFAFRTFEGFFQLLVPLVLLVLFVGVGVNVFRGDSLLSPSGWAVFDVRDNIAPVVAVLNSTASNISDSVENFGVVQVAVDNKK